MQATKRSLIVGILFLAIFISTSFAQTQVKNNSTNTALHPLREHYIVKAYLHGGGLQNAMSIESSGKDLLRLLENIKDKQPLATLTIESVKYVAKDGTVSFVKDLPHPFNENIDSTKFVSAAVQQINQLKTYSFVSANIYFFLVKVLRT